MRQFLADASHELRTPLSSIRGYAELFRIGAAAEPDDLEKSMARIEAESERMGRLVDDLLALARLDEVREPVREPRRSHRGSPTRCSGDALATDRDRSIELTAPGVGDGRPATPTSFAACSPTSSPTPCGIRRRGHAGRDRHRRRGRRRSRHRPRPRRGPHPRHRGSGVRPLLARRLGPLARPRRYRARPRDRRRDRLRTRRPGRGSERPRRRRHLHRDAAAR